MIDCLIFSKNRPMQCELLLRSIKVNFKQLTKISILYKYTNDFYRQGYDKLMNKFSRNNIIWHQENNFEQQTKNIINGFNQPYIVCFVDDDVVINQIEDGEYRQIFEAFGNKENVYCFSLRMSRNINYCGSAKVSISIPKFLRQDVYLLWDWTKEDDRYDWGYPCAINSTIYKTNGLKSSIQNLYFTNVNQLEGEMDNHKNYNKPYMYSSLESKTFNVANNFVKSEKNICEYPEYSIEKLNQLFLEGYVIDVSKFQGLVKNTVHGYLPYLFI